MCSYKSLNTDNTDLTKLPNNIETQVDLISSCPYIEMYLNVHSLMNKQTDLNKVLNNLQNETLTIDIIFLCETYLNDCTQKRLMCLVTI